MHAFCPTADWSTRDYLIETRNGLGIHRPVKTVTCMLVIGPRLGNAPPVARNRHYRLASLSTKQMVSNECHKRERQVNQNHASGSDNFNGAEEVQMHMLVAQTVDLQTAQCNLQIV